MNSPTTQVEGWRVRAQTRKQQQHDSIPPEWKISVQADRFNVLSVPYECGLLSPLELEITDTLDVGEILEKLASGEWSSMLVTTAFYKRALVAHQTTNCLTEIFVERALARAKEMDVYLAEHGKPKGPLHGLPISLKDQFTIKGLETINGIRIGYVANIGDFATEDCVLVQILYDLGAVPFTRTNLPQTLMWGETYNNVFGRTVNPYDTRLTPGGSSGGEGALIAMRGSPLGVGTDIGGSIRIPASMCGVYGLRPSYCRLPYYGARNCLEGQESVMSVLGPMCNSLSGLKIFTKAIIDSRPWVLDPLCIRKVWDEDAYQLIEHGGRGRKCFAVLYDDGLVKPHPPVFRAMDMVRKALEAAGHQGEIVIEWENRKHEEIFYNIEKQIFLADGGEDYARECALSGEPHIQTMDPTLYSHEVHDTDLTKNKGIEIIKPLSVWELWELHKTKRDLRKEYLDHWNATVSRTSTGRPVDAIISPAIPYAATPHGKNSSPFYTSLWNAVDYTVGVLPVTFVDAEVDKAVPLHAFYSDDDRDIYHLYDPEVFKGAPIGVQVVGQRLEEEAVLGMMEEVDEALRKYKAQYSLM
ncbi:Amidase [Ceratobasidium theobromae]|uniref:amidase n=1 Tax=Ceratobasidium theobromae TaxID=1582974 RepID=A0A5N5QBK5_9AGAM|nr:Amidase [Ceratobasidium theobromae]